jgi:hypothetical protein
VTFSRRGFARWLVALGWAGLGACRKREKAKPARASFGVFFGGEVQEREEVPLILDRTRQSIGVRVTFEEPPAKAEPVSWELEKPGTGKDGGPGVVDYGQARARPGERTLDIPLAFRAGDRTGTWRVRVMLGSESLLDRPFRVVPPSPASPREE